jgi:hypothetical protein
MTLGKSPTKSETANKVVEIAGAADDVSPVLRRALDDMPSLVHHPGAKEVAVLTVVAKEQAFAFQPAMQALEFLSSNKIDWSKEFLVAHPLETRVGASPYFNWKNAPTQTYRSFKDFYRRELESIWGSWEDLRETYAKVIRGDLNEPEAAKEIIERGKLRAHGGDRRSEQGDNTKKDITLKGRGTSRSYTMARLDRDRPDLAAKVDAGLMTANAAAIEAKFRKKPTRKTRVQRTFDRIQQWTKLERRALWKLLKDEFD